MTTRLIINSTPLNTPTRVILINENNELEHLFKEEKPFNQSFLQSLDTFLNKENDKKKEKSIDNTIRMKSVVEYLLETNENILFSLLLIPR